MANKARKYYERVIHTELKVLHVHRSACFQVSTYKLYPHSAGEFMDRFITDFIASLREKLTLDAKETKSVAQPSILQYAKNKISPKL